ncbi:MAG TPA: DUF2059 domain-containing protein [Terriglobales bacterium]|jgi:hypothetical protein|nr:DUF2059 domain-containing protein [Terriglobales bacterium]
MKRLLLLTFLVAVATYPVFAQQGPTSSGRPPSVEQVMKFFEVMQLRQKMQTMLEAEQKQTDTMVTEMFSKRLPDATQAQRAQFVKIVNGAISEVFDNYPIDEMLRDMVPVYQSHLSESDLEEIVVFYSSPVGQKVIREMPAMTADAMRISFAHLQPRIDGMMKKMQEQLEAMATGGSTPAAQTKN